MSIPSVKNVPLINNTAHPVALTLELGLFFDFLLWVFPMTVHFSEKFNLLFDIDNDNFNLPNNFEQHGLNPWYFTWVFLITRPFRRYQHLWLCDRDLDFLKKKYLVKNFFNKGRQSFYTLYDHFLWHFLWKDDLTIAGGICVSQIHFVRIKIESCTSWFYDK